MVDIKKLQALESLTPRVQPGTVSKVPSDGPSFKEALADVGFEETLKTPQVPAAKPLQSGLSIGQTGGLTTATNLNGVKALESSVKFSNHAIERMRSRGVSYTPDEMQKLNEAVTKAAAKGSKDTLILTDNSALIVSVKNKTVVTVMDKAALKENVFTNIDSTVVL